MSLRRMRPSDIEPPSDRRRPIHVQRPTEGDDHMTDKSLFEPYALGTLTLSNRIVMAPLTRNRAGPGLVPGTLAAEY